MNKFLTYANRIARNTIENKDIHHAKDIFIPDDDYDRGHKTTKASGAHALYYDPWTTILTTRTAVVEEVEAAGVVIIDHLVVEEEPDPTLLHHPLLRFPMIVLSPATRTTIIMVDGDPRGA